ncbi:MAG: class B sortase [Oscillospiraceae bacterium]|nr:class B sortase [Oscillospiraceae bacterium]
MKAFFEKNLKKILIVLCAILVCVFGYSAYRIFSTLNGYRVAEQTYTEITEQVVTVVASPTPLPAAQIKPDVDPEVSPITVDFEMLRNTSTDYVAYIYCPDTKINYPVAYTDNNFYYIDHIPPDTVNANGTIFIDCRNASDFSDQNTCIYGHNMNDGSMFATLRDYRTEGFYAEHPVMYISTPEFNYRVDLIAGFVTEPTSFAYAGQFDSEEQFMAHIELCRDLSTFESDVEVTAEDRIVTLSTCTYEIDDGRYVVVGKLTQIH